MSSSNKKSAKKPYWTCECGQKEAMRDDDELVTIGKATFRKPGCPVCRRPMQFSGNRPPESPGLVMA